MLSAARPISIVGLRCWIGCSNTGLPMFDDSSGGGFDGLQPDSVNLNQGADSTLYVISTMQRACSLVPTP